MTEIMKRSPGNPQGAPYWTEESGAGGVHATTHKAGGADPIRLDELDEPTDVTALNASAARHGLLPKLLGGTTNFLRADGAFAAPPGGSGASLTRIDGASGAAGLDFTVQRLNANSADVTTTTLSASVMTTTGLGAGLWKLKYALLCQTAATGTGIGFGINHTGTVTLLRALLHTITTGGAAATGVADGVTATVAGQLAEGKQGGTLNAVIGSTFAGVDTANATFLVILEAMLLVTGSGDLELKIASEVGGSAVRLMAQSCVEMVKVA